MLEEQITNITHGNGSASRLVSYVVHVGAFSPDKLSFDPKAKLPRDGIQVLCDGMPMNSRRRRDWCPLTNETVIAFDPIVYREPVKQTSIRKSKEGVVYETWPHAIREHEQMLNYQVALDDDACSSGELINWTSDEKRFRQLHAAHQCD